MLIRSSVVQTASKLAVAAVLSAFVFCINPALADCPTVEEVCDTWGPYLGLDLEALGGCVGPECFDKSYGDEVTVVAADDSLFPEKWKLRHSGIINNLSCESVEDKSKSDSDVKTTLWIPASHHCAVTHVTVNHFYVHFFASNAELQCLGWAQCKAY